MRCQTFKICLEYWNHFKIYLVATIPRNYNFFVCWGHPIYHERSSEKFFKCNWFCSLKARRPQYSSSKLQHVQRTILTCARSSHFHWRRKIVKSFTATMTVIIITFGRMKTTNHLGSKFKQMKIATFYFFPRPQATLPLPTDKEIQNKNKRYSLEINSAIHVWGKWPHIFDSCNWISQEWATEWVPSCFCQELRIHGSAGNNNNNNLLLWSMMLLLSKTGGGKSFYFRKISISSVRLPIWK